MPLRLMPAIAAHPHVGFGAILLLLALAATTSCRSDRERLGATATSNLRTAAPINPPEPSAANTAIALSEAEARALLAERFRAAGLRIVYDVRIERAGAFDVTVDGYDPARHVGFEYIAAAERDTDFTAAERAALADDDGHNLLIVGPMSSAALAAATAQFLDAIAAQ